MITLVARPWPCRPSSRSTPPAAGRTRARRPVPVDGHARPTTACRRCSSTASIVLAGQVLNARDRFGPMMWAPIANNVVSIAASCCCSWSSSARPTPRPPFTSGQEVLLGHRLHAWASPSRRRSWCPFLRSAGYRFRPRFDFRHTGLGQDPPAGQVGARLRAGHPARPGRGQQVATAATIGRGRRRRTGGLRLRVRDLDPAALADHRLAGHGDAAERPPGWPRPATCAGVADETTRTIRLAVTALLPTSVAFVVLGLPIARLIFGFGQGAEDWQFTSATP